jgi:hypothetical protein
VKTSLVFAAIVAVALLTSCVQKAVRYSPSELAKFPPQVQRHIERSEVALGMTPEAVRYSWGAPGEIRILPVDEEGRLTEEWVYSRMGFYETRLVFTEGVVTGIVSGMKEGLGIVRKPSAEDPGDGDGNSK